MARSVCLLYGALGRQVDEHVVESWEIVLQRRTNYQVESATQLLLQTWRHAHPPTAFDLCDRAGDYAISEEAERRLKLVNQGPKEDPAAVREAMAEACRRNIRAGNHVEFYKDVLRNFEEADDAPTAEQRRSPGRARRA